MARCGVRPKPGIAGRGDRSRRSATASPVSPQRRPWRRRNNGASPLGDSRIARRSRTRNASWRVCWHRSATDRHASRSDKSVARIRSRSRGRAHRLFPVVPAAFGKSSASRICVRHRAARSSRWALRCAPQARAPDDLRAADGRASIHSIASLGVGGTKGRARARASTAGGKMRGNDLVRRASVCRFLSALSACHLDVIGIPGSGRMMASKP